MEVLRSLWQQFAGRGWMNEENLRKTLLALELELLSPLVRGSEARLDGFLADEFVEFGSSGRIFDKQSIMRLIGRAEPTENFEIKEFRLVTSSEDTALVSYSCDARGDAGDISRRSNRSSMWISRSGRWQMIFHQGTKTA